MPGLGFKPPETMSTVLAAIGTEKGNKSLPSSSHGFSNIFHTTDWTSHGNPSYQDTPAVIIAHYIALLVDVKK
jgi:hypothetical protein